MKPILIKTTVISMVTYVTLILINMLYKVFFGNEVVCFRVETVTEMSGSDDFIRDLLDDGTYHYDLDYEILKTSTSNIEDIYISYHFKPRKVYRKNDLMCGYITFVSPASLIDFLKPFFGKNVYKIHNVELVNNLTESQINEMFDQKSKGYLSKHIYIFLISLALIIIGYFLNKKIKPSFKNQNDKISFNKPLWLETSNIIILLTIFIFSLYLLYHAFSTGALFYAMLFFLLPVFSLFRLIYEIRNINDYLIISKDHMSIKDNKRIEKVFFDDIRSVQFTDSGLKILTNVKEINFNYSSLNLDSYAANINDNVKKVLADKIL
jgi:hypothetical protein